MSAKRQISCLLTISANHIIVSHLHRTMNAGQLLDSAAGPVAMAAIPAMSATWFPPDQRTTATAIASRVQAFGGALPFVLGISVNQTIR